MKVEDMSNEDLVAATKELGRRRVIQEINQLADSIDHSVKLTPNKGPRAKIAAKYADDEGNSWSGRGKRPKWLVAATEDGTPVDSFEIK